MNSSLPDHLVRAIEVLDYFGHEGLVTTESRPGPGPRDYIWQDLREKVGLRAAFFHDGVPLVGFSSEVNDEGLLALRSRLWNYGRVPLLVNTTDDSASAFNALTTPKSGTNVSSGVLARGRRSQIADGLLDAFQRSEVLAGSFASLHSESYKTSARVDRALLTNLAYLRQHSFTGTAGYRQALDTVIGGCLVASYLADRGILNEEHLQEIAGVRDLQAVLVGGTDVARRLFEGLTARFNGDIFGPIPETMQVIEQSDLASIASLLRGDDLPTGQQALWPYDFSTLPADLVSSIYEQLLEESRSADSAYYTPKFLVDTVLDEVIPWSGDSQLRIIDLACGSGAFMTEAFRRLAYRERRRLDRELTYAELQQVLMENVYGIELNIDSARIAVFGLYLALLEELDPPTIWDSAVLPTLLGRNVIVSDAFEPHALSGMQFDAVVSNPPWQSRLTAAAARYVTENDAPVADRQIAQAFLWLSADFLRPGGTLGLVMPAKPLLHNRSTQAQIFRSRLFERLEVHALVDLSAVRRSIFATAIAPAAVIVASVPSEPDDVHGGRQEAGTEEILYVAPHPRSMNRVVDSLVITPEEVRSVSRQQARFRPDIWKTLLWGSSRDVELLDRLRVKFPSVGEIASERQWTFGQGYQVGGGDANDASHLGGFSVIPTNVVTPLRLRPSSFEGFDLPTLHRPRDPALFRGPHVLVRRTLADGRLVAALVDEDAVFPNGVLGFAARNDRPLLLSLTGAIVSSLGNYFHFMTSASWGVERDFVELNEHLSLPLATPSARQAIALSDLFDEARDGLSAGLLDELDSIMFDIYELSEHDRERVRDRLESGLERFRRPLSSGMPAGSVTLVRYASKIHDVLTAMLSDLYVETKSYSRGAYRAVTVTLTDGPPSVHDGQTELVDVDMQRIIEMNAGRGTGSTGVVAQPAGFFVDQDTIFVVKTADPDRWGVDAALDDAERILTALAFGS